MGLPPWSNSPSQRFVLVTGTNGGVGFATCQRIIDEFLTSPTRDPRSHLVLIVSTRSEQKTHQVITGLRKYLRLTTERSSTAKYLRKQAIANGRKYDWKQVAARVHFLGVELDLCNLIQIYEAAAKIKGENGGLGTPDILVNDDRSVTGGKGASLKNITIPRIDVIINNAGIGGWSGIRWPSAVFNVLINVAEAVTWWEWWKFPNPSALTKQESPIDGADSPLYGSQDHLLDSTGHIEDVYKNDHPKLGQIFCSNVFGHYILCHELMPLLWTSNGRDPGERGRILWISTIEALAKSFSVDDLQGLRAENPYSSSKRLTDYLCLTYSLRSVRNISSAYLSIDGDTSSSEVRRRTPKRRASSRYTSSDGNASGHHDDGTKPEMYLVHPGICATAIAGIHWFLALFMIAAFYVARWVKSPWHPISTYTGACAPAWVALASQSLLDSLEEFDGSYAQAKPKWGTATDRLGNASVMKTEAPGYGWTGRIGDNNVDGWQGTRRGRKADTPDVTPEQRVEFEEVGRQAWIQMEEMRRDWETRLGIRKH